MTGPTAAAAASPYSGFRKRTQSLGPWLRGWLWLLAHLHHVLAVVFHRLDPALRESIMIAVAEVNACRWCSYAHQTWGREVGLDESDLAMLADGQVALPDARRAAAVAYARERADAGFGPVPEPLRARLRSVFDARDADRVEVVARLMHQGNMTGNGLDSLLARWQGRRPASTRLVDDLVIGVFGVLAILFAVPLTSLVWRRSPLGVSRELLAFVRSYESAPRGSHALASGASSRATHTVAHTAAMMRIVGWSVLLATPLAAAAYPAGFLWGTHPESPYQPFSPYAFMLVAMYVAWGALMVRGARDPRANRAIVDYGILANALHGLVMLVQAFAYPHEHQHLWADVPLLFVVCAVLWRWYPLAPRDAQAPTSARSHAAHALARSATAMRLVGWGVLVVIPLGLVAYPAGFLWGTHPGSPYAALLSPYLLMLVAMYVAWAALMIRGARDPLANRAIVDYGILANALHGLVMLVQTFAYPHEHQHLWADVPLLFVICAVLWHWHPGRVAR